MRAIFGAAAALLAAYVPVWWWLVFTGYYRDRASDDTVAYMKTFLVSDGFLFALTVGLVAGLRRRAPWGNVCAFSPSSPTSQIGDYVNSGPRPAAVR